MQKAKSGTRTKKMVLATLIHHQTINLQIKIFKTIFESIWSIIDVRREHTYKPAKLARASGEESN